MQSKAVFSMRHYNRIWNVISGCVETHREYSANSDLDDGIEVGMMSIHAELGSMFKMDNPKFNPNLWELTKQE
jgi:hypothetical protein